MEKEALNEDDVADLERSLAAKEKDVSRPTSEYRGSREIYANLKAEYDRLLANSSKYSLVHFCFYLVIGSFISYA